MTARDVVVSFRRAPRNVRVFPLNKNLRMVHWRATERSNVGQLAILSHKGVRGRVSIFYATSIQYLSVIRSRTHTVRYMWLGVLNTPVAKLFCILRLDCSWSCIYINACIDRDTESIAAVYCCVFVSFFFGNTCMRVSRIKLYANCRFDFFFPYFSYNLLRKLN